MREKAYLVLGNGRVFEGERIGASGESLGELVFTTGMVGYLETLSDPSYTGQIILQTFPLIGNYGVITEDLEGSCFAKGYVVRELCDTPSNFRSEGPLETLLKDKGIPGICGVDTREITRLIREEGVMNAAICSAVPADLGQITAYAVKDAVPRASSHSIMEHAAAGEERFHVVLIDYGVKKSIVRALCSRGCRVTAVPYDTTAESILAMHPDGVALSNGPGDPADNPFCIEQVRKVIGEVPVFGVCLGHQIAALAMGGKTMKLKYGHRGANQPVHCIDNGRTYITSQNHGYAVISESVRDFARILFENANDGTCEGVEYPGKECLTVQFHPEAHSGPNDTAFLFDRFLAMMEAHSHAER